MPEQDSKFMVNANESSLKPKTKLKPRDVSPNIPMEQVHLLFHEPVYM